jgi:hypothetical protein
MASSFQSNLAMFDRYTRQWGQIVIGAGSSALNFLYSAYKGSQKWQFVHQKTLVIGETDLWRPMDPNHQMGQPGKILRGVEEWKQTSDGTWEKQQYLSSGGYVKSLDNMKSTIKVQREREGGEIEFMNDKVSSVAATGDGYAVTTAKNGVFYTKQVIVASGAGPGKKLDASGSRSIPITGAHTLESSPRGYVEILDATDYLYSTPPPGLITVIFGGSATASWAAAHAYHNSADFIWLCAQGLAQIKVDGDPVSRNTETIKRAAKEKRIFKGSIVSVEVTAGDTSAGMGSGGPPRLSVKLKFVSDNNFDSPFKDAAEFEGTLPVHQLVHGLGADPLAAWGPGAILDASIRQNLEVKWDKEKRLGAEKTAIALYHRNQQATLWIVGASVFRGGGGKDASEIMNSYNDVNKILTHASRPPEGIANLKFRIQALTGHHETDPAKFDWTLASQDQISRLLRGIYGDTFKGSLREAFAQKIIENRANTRFTLNRPEVKTLFTQFIHDNSLTFEVARLQLDLPAPSGFQAGRNRPPSV